MSANKYRGQCHACKRPVPAGAGVLEPTGGFYRGRRHHGWLLWCMDCYNKSDNSGPEDRCCGNRAYEDQCARAVGDNPEYYGGGW